MRKISTKIDVEISDIKESEEKSETFREKFLPDVYQKLEHRRLVMLLDELDYSKTVHDQEEIFHFLPALDKLILEETKIGFVAVVGPQFFRPSNSLGQLIKHSEAVPVGRMKSETAQQLILELAPDHLNYTNAALNKILELSARHPYLLQSICSEIFNLLVIDKNTEGAIEVEVKDVEQAMEMALESGIGCFTWLKHELFPEEQAFLHMCAEMADNDGRFKQADLAQLHYTYVNASGYLTKIEILKRENTDTYRFVSEMFRRWSLNTPS